MYYINNYKIERSISNISAILEYLDVCEVKGYELRIYQSCIILSGGKKLDISGVVPASSIIKEW